MNKYAILHDITAVPPPSSFFDFVGTALALVMPIAMSVIGASAVQALSMNFLAMRTSAAELTSPGSGSITAMPQRPWRPARSLVPSYKAV